MHADLTASSENEIIPRQFVLLSDLELICLTNTTRLQTIQRYTGSPSVSKTIILSSIQCRLINV